MTLPIPYGAKRFLRLCDSFLTPRKGRVNFRAHSYRFYYPYWWPTATQSIFDQEISPYFECLEDFIPKTLLDVGSAEGHFAITACKTFPGCAVTAFEPALRQRILLSRNARLNGVVKQLTIEPFGLWNREDELPFRMNGAESSFAPVSHFRGRLAFPETLRVLPLDQWATTIKLAGIDLIKMDAEGAEIEILEGARNVLTQFQPRLLIQAYHMREGARTFERCAEILGRHGYRVCEASSSPGLLYARPN